MYAAECRYVLLLLHHIDFYVAIGQIHIEIKGQRRFWSLIRLVLCKRRREVSAG